MAGTIAKFVGGIVAVTLLARGLFVSNGPGFRPPGVARAGSSQSCSCRSIAKRVKDTDLFVCANCGRKFGVAECVGDCIAQTDRNYRWVCGKGHTTTETRKCPCGRLGEPVGGGWWKCKNPRGCAKFARGSCRCEYGNADHGYATITVGTMLWFCELTGNTWSGK